MKQYTHDNHFKYGYNHNWFTERQSEEDVWTVEYGVCSRPVSDFKTECLNTARQIREDTDLPITICFSGGVDSEITVKSFMECGIPFKIAILQFKEGLNEHDTFYSKKFCRDHGLDYQLIELDLLRFWNSDMYDYAERTKCVTPQLLSTMWLVDQIDDYAILGSGECYVVKQIPKDYVPGVSPYEPSPWHLWEKEKIASWYRHFMISNRDGAPGFFQYNPEIMLSFLLDDTVKNLVDNRIIGKLSTYTSKLGIYQKYFTLQDRPKYTGFEYVMEEDSYHRRILEEKYGMYNQVYKSEYYELIGKLNCVGTCFKL